MKVENLKADGFEAALRGMRNPLDSWDKSDSQFGILNTGFLDEDALTEVAEPWIRELTKDKNEEETEHIINSLADRVYEWLKEEGNYDYDPRYDYCKFAYIGPKDMALAQRLIAAGPEHCKFLRQINISFDVVAPFYW